MRHGNFYYIIKTYEFYYYSLINNKCWITCTKLYIHFFVLEYMKNTLFTTDNFTDYLYIPTPVKQYLRTNSHRSHVQNDTFFKEKEKKTFNKCTEYVKMFFPCI